MVDAVPKPKSKFIKVTCDDCGNEQIVFNKASSVVKCLVCGRTLAETTGGKARIKSEKAMTILE